MRYTKMSSGRKRGESVICESELDDVSSPQSYDWGSDTGSDKHDFAYDDVDNRQTVSRTGSSTQYYSVNALTYDWGSDTGADKHDFTFDDVDSRSTVSRTGSSTQYYSVNSLNQYLEIDTVSGLQSADRTYDLNGNLKTTEAGVSYSYDYKNHLVQALNTDDYRVSFEYDYFGRRTYKKYEDWTGSAWTTVSELYFYHAGDEVIEERDASDSVQRTYVLSDRLDHPVSIREGSADFYYHYNALGSVVKLTDSSENIVEEYSYDVYGMVNIDTNSGAVNNAYLFTGRYYDSEINLYYYRFRTYDPSTGSFLQRDPIGYADSSGLYSYVAASPASWVDPFGLAGEDMDVDGSFLGNFLVGAGKDVWNILSLGVLRRQEQKIKETGAPVSVGQSTMTVLEQAATITTLGATDAYVESVASGNSGLETAGCVLIAPLEALWEGLPVDNLYAIYNLYSQGKLTWEDAVLQASQAGGELGALFLARQAMKAKAANAADDAARAAVERDLAHNAANMHRVKIKLTLEEGGILDSKGNLTTTAINEAELIVEGASLKNPKVIHSLTCDGSMMSDWAKFKTRSVGGYQAHFYKNVKTGAVNTTIDYKVVGAGK